MEDDLPLSDPATQFLPSYISWVGGLRYEAYFLHHSVEDNFDAESEQIADEAMTNLLRQLGILQKDSQWTFAEKKNKVKEYIRKTHLLELGESNLPSPTVSETVPEEPSDGRTIVAPPATTKDSNLNTEAPVDANQVDVGAAKKNSTIQTADGSVVVCPPLATEVPLSIFVEPPAKPVAKMPIEVSRTRSGRLTNPKRTAPTSARPSVDEPAKKKKRAPMRD